jgi:hypothetical protein
MNRTSYPKYYQHETTLAKGRLPTSVSIKENRNEVRSEKLTVQSVGRD